VKDYPDFVSNMEGMVAEVVLLREEDSWRGVEMRPNLDCGCESHWADHGEIEQEREEEKEPGEITIKPHPSASAKGRDKRRNEGGYKAAINGGASSRLTGEPL
jgi:hypothetical protein